MHYTDLFKYLKLIISCKFVTLFFLTFVIINGLAAKAIAEMNILRIGTVAIPPSIGNPYRNTGPPHLFTWSATFDGLTRFNKYGELIQWLAISWENVDKLTWRIHLRDKVTFSNGEKFTSESVITSINYLLSSKSSKEAVAREFDYIRSVRSINELTIEITTKSAIPFLPRTLPILHIVEPKSWTKLGPEGFSKEPIGTGPFKLVSYSPGILKYESFDSSWRAPNISKLELIAVPDSFSRAQGVASGQLDIAISIGPDEANLIKNNGGKALSWPSASLWAINFHHQQNGPFDNILVRKAINLAIDRASLVDNLLEGKTSIASQPAPRIAFGYNNALEEIQYDPLKAKILLTQAGYPNGFKFVVQGVLGAGANHSAMYQKVSQDLLKIGVTMEIHPIPISQLIRGVMKGEWKGDAFGSTYDTEPTLDVLRPLRNHSCLWSHPWYCNQKIMPKIKEALKTFDINKALELRHEIMSFYRNEWVSLFLYESVRFAGTKDYVNGFSEENGFINYEKIYFKSLSNWKN